MAGAGMSIARRRLNLWLAVAAGQPTANGTSSEAFDNLHTDPTMNEPPPLMDAPSPAPAPGPQAPATSLAARLLNVFATPVEVFDEVRTSAHVAANWLVPAILGSVVGLISVVIVLSQPAIQQKIREQQDQAIEKRLEKLVKAGTITQQQADQQRAMAEKFTNPTLTKIMGAAGAVFLSFARVFLWALVLWLLGRWLLRSRFGYLKATEVAGLAGMIGVLGTIVTLLLKVNFSNPASSPSLALVVGEFDPKNPAHLLLAALNLFDFWQLAVMAVGVARLAGVPFVRAGLVVCGFWFVWSFVVISISTVLARLFG